MNGFSSHWSNGWQTESAKELAGVILETDSSLWWFSDKGEWWVTGGKH